MAKSFTKNHLYIVFRFLAEIAARVGSFITFPLMAKYLGTEGYGVQTQINAITGILIPIATIGLGFSVVRVVAGKNDISYISARFFSTFLTVMGFSSILTLLVIIAAPWLNNLFVKVEWATPVIRWAALLVVFTSLELMLNDYYRARLRILAYSVFQVFHTIATVCGIVLVFRLGGNLLEIVQLFLVVKAVLILVMTGYLKAVGEIQFRTQLMPRTELMEMIRFGVPIVVMGISMWVMSLGDRIVIGYYMDVDTVGIYGASYKLAGILAALASPFWGPLYPIMATHKNNNNHTALAAASRKYTNAYLLIGIPALFGLTVLSPQFIQIFGSAEFVIHPLVFGCIALGLFSDQFSASAHYLVYLENQPKFLRNITILAGLLNIGMNIVLVPLWGILGAALATLASYFILNLFLFRKIISYGYRINDIYDIAAILRLLISAGVMSVVVYVIKDKNVIDMTRLLGTVILGGVCYGTVLLAINGFSLAKIVASR